MITKKFKSIISKTRNQMLLGFVLVMAIVLIIAQLSTFFSLSKQLKEDSEKYITTIIEQMEGRINAFLEEINNKTLELSLNQDVQDVLFKEKKDKEITLDDRLKIRNTFINVKTFTHMIRSINLYSLKQTIYPIENVKLSEKLNPDWIKKADRESGKLVWLGLDPNYPQDLVAIRQVRIVNDNYNKGGYLLIRVVKELLLFIEKDLSKFDSFLFYLIDKQNQVISSNNDTNLFSSTWLNKEFISLNNNMYFSVKREIEKTNWTLLILTPFSRITKGVSNLKNILLFAGITGTILFVILSIFLSSLITRPVRKMMTAMRHDVDGLLKFNPESYFNHEINELNKNYNKMVEKNNHLVKVVYEKELSKTKAEIEAIQAQINPHFLYNTLEAFYWTLVEREEDELSDLILSLSNLFRYTIKTDENDMIHLQKELNHIKRYLEIMKFRLGDRLDWDIKLEEKLSDVLIPKLTIQPLVENAIMHGIERKIDRGYVEINIKKYNQEFIKIMVKDNGKGINQSLLLKIKNCLSQDDYLDSSNSGIGLKNIKKRLQCNYGDKARLEIESKENKGTSVELIIPERRKKE